MKTLACAIVVAATALLAVAVATSAPSNDLPKGSIYAVGTTKNQLLVLDGADGGAVRGHEGHFPEVSQQKQTVLVTDTDGTTVLSWTFMDYYGSLTNVDPDTFELTFPGVTLADHPEDLQWDWKEQVFVGVCMEKSTSGNAICTLDPETGKRTDLVPFSHHFGFVVGATALDVEAGLFYVELLNTGSGFFIMVVDIRREEQVGEWPLPNLGTGIRLLKDGSGLRTIGRAPKEFVPAAEDLEQRSHCEHGSLVVFSGSDAELCSAGDSSDHPQFMYSIDSEGVVENMNALDLRYPILHAATMVTVRGGALRDDVEAYVVGTSTWHGDKHSLSMLVLSAESGKLVHEAKWPVTAVRSHFKTPPAFL